MISSKYIIMQGKEQKVAADKPTFEEGKQYHIECKPNDLKGPVLLPGDPERARRIAETWDEFKEIAAHRQYYSFTGKVHKVPISVTSTGIHNSPSTPMVIARSGWSFRYCGTGTPVLTAP